MKVVIIAGAGEVGRGVAQALIYERKNVILIDSDPDALKSAQSLECLLIAGDVMSRETLNHAGIQNAELLIMATDSDERNILGCAFAKDHRQNMESASGEMVTIARVNRMSVARQDSSEVFHRWSQVDHVANADKEIVDELTAGLISPHILHTAPMGNDAYLSVSKITEGSALLGDNLIDAAEKIDGLPIPVGIVGSGGKSTIIDESTVAESGDLLLFAATGLHVQNRISNACGFTSEPMVDNPRVIIFGATSIGTDLASHYLENESSVTVVEPDLNVANDLVGSDLGNQRRLDVIHGEPSDIELLKDIGMSDHDIAISTLDDDNGAIAIAMRAVDEGVDRTGLIVDDSTLVDTVRRIGLTRAVSRREVSISAIMEHVHSYVEGRFQIIRQAKDFVAMSVTLDSNHSTIGQPISKLESKFKGGAKIVLLERNRDGMGPVTFTPDSEMMLEPNDRLIILLLRDSITAVEAKLRS
ncbi:MAG: NAD-binding protein [Candidatus Thermoplasmatota archaeon]|nr:NAD-binding protein [Candidatus Thermoplasmatota archaeon]